MDDVTSDRRVIYRGRKIDLALQSVRLADGHATWLSSRRVSAADSDLYLNNARRPAYGLGPQDSVLMPASLRVNPR